MRRLLITSPQRQLRVREINNCTQFKQLAAHDVIKCGQRVTERLFLSVFSPNCTRGNKFQIRHDHTLFMHWIGCTIFSYRFGYLCNILSGWKRCYCGCCVSSRCSLLRSVVDDHLNVFTAETEKIKYNMRMMKHTCVNGATKCILCVISLGSSALVIGYLWVRRESDLEDE